MTDTDPVCPTCTTRLRHQAEAAKRLSLLSPRALEVLAYVADGHPNADISLQLDISEKTVRNYVSIMFDLCGVTNRTQLARLAWEAHG